MCERRDNCINCELGDSYTRTHVSLTNMSSTYVWSASNIQFNWAIVGYVDINTEGENEIVVSECVVISKYCMEICSFY